MQFEYDSDDEDYEENNEIKVVERLMVLLRPWFIEFGKVGIYNGDINFLKDAELLKKIRDFKIISVNVDKKKSSTYTLNTAPPGGQGAYPDITITIYTYIITFEDVYGLKYESHIYDRIQPNRGQNGYVSSNEFSGVMPSKEISYFHLT